MHRGDLVEIARRRDLDNVHADQFALADEALDQLDRLPVGDATRLRAFHCRHHRRVEPVGVDGEIIAAAIRNALQQRSGADVLPFIGGDDVGAIGTRR